MANRTGPALTRMGCGPIQVGPIGPDFIRAANFTARPSKILGQFGPAHRARPIFPALFGTDGVRLQQQLSSQQMAPFEALYGRKCRTPVCWDEVGERILVDPELVQITSEKVKVVRDNLKIARDRHKSYADNRRRDLQFKIGDQVFLKISPWKGVLRFGKLGKLSPRYIGPYEIVSKVGPVAYKLKLPPELSRIHDTFHVLMLRKYILDSSHVLREQPVHLKENLTYEETPVQIVDRKEQVLRIKVIPLVKVLWKNHEREAATWESEAQMRRQYPQLFS